MKIQGIWSYLISPFSDVETKTSTKGKNLQILDGVRGLAVLIVIASHTSAFRLYGQGSLGVLLFFFLSGIVLIIPFANSPGSILSIKEISLYFINRFCRIVPLYVIIVGAITIDRNQTLEWFLWNVSFEKGWNHLWSVAEEVRFYILLPAVICLMAIFNNKYITVIIFLCLIYFSFEYRGIHKIDMLNGRHVQFYFFMFLAGSLTYILTTLPMVETYLKNIIFEKIFTTATLLIFLFFLFSSTDMVQFFWKPIFTDLPQNFKLNGWRMPGTWLFLFTVFFFSLIIYSKGIVHGILIHYFFRHIGLLSYSLYLSHMTIRKYLTQYGFEHEGLFFSTLICSYLIALVTYIVIEKPFLILKKAILKRLHRKPTPEVSLPYGEKKTEVSV